MSSVDQLGSGGISGDLGVLHRASHQSWVRDPVSEQSFQLGLRPK